MTIDTLRLTAEDAAGLVERGEVSSAELVAAYREAIKSALVDAMLEHSRGINIQPDEWLTIAAHRGDSGLTPNEIVTTSTLVLRIKGSDLAVYDADRTKKDEIRKRVEAREF